MHGTTPTGLTAPDAQDRNETLAPRLAALKRELARTGPLLVSYSGGVDSALLAVVARAVLGDGMACAFLDGPLVLRTNAVEAHAIARAYDLPLAVLAFDPLKVPAIAANPADRCYHCKKAIGSLLKREAADRGLGLSFAEKPSSACLASRVPYGEPLAPAVLAMVEEAEEALSRIGFTQARVRVHGRLARIGVPPGKLARALASTPDLIPALKAAGFAYVALDLEGYRPGAMDEVLGDMTK